MKTFIQGPKQHKLQLQDEKMIAAKVAGEGIIMDSYYERMMIFQRNNERN